MTHRIQIQPTTIRGERGQYYRVHYDGSVLIDETWNPELEACRALLARGIVGQQGRPNPGQVAVKMPTHNPHDFENS